MGYLVKFVSENGTESDNEYIGVFDSLIEAKKERIKYVSKNVGSLNEYCFNCNDYSNTTVDDYLDNLKYYFKQTGIIEI